MNIKDSFRALTKFEWGLWLVSVAVIITSSLVVPKPDVLSMIASFIGVTALIFVAKGYVLGQILCIIFAVFYGIVSFSARYYGEMITYLGMSAPAALVATISWIRNPYKKSAEVKVARLTKGKTVVLFLVTGAITWAFYYILGALGTANLIVSTFSVATSFLASALLIFRSPMYALAYAANDIVLITLWVMAAFEDPSSAPMIACFLMFLCNDLYGFIQWKKMRKRQENDA
jgi:nicotinamide mononucleotide transporter PnuC